MYKGDEYRFQSPKTLSVRSARLPLDRIVGYWYQVGYFSFLLSASASASAV